MGFTRKLAAVATAIIFLTFALGTGSASADTPYTAGTIGNDISYPQCNDKPIPISAFGLIGVNGGKAWTVNPCIAKQYQWAAGLPGQPGFYVNTANPGPANPHWTLPGPKQCLDYTTPNDKGCAYNYGWNSANDSFNTAAAAVGSAAATRVVWWLDIETANSWDGSTAANSAAIQGFYDGLIAHGIAIVGVYSTPLQWRGLTGGYSLPQAPNWISTGPDADRALSYCSQNMSMTGGPLWLVQVYIDSHSGDYACPTGNAAAIASTQPSNQATGQAVAAVTSDLPSGPADIALPSASCSAGGANITFNWKPTAGARFQWLDVSLNDNSFAPGTFSSAGPLDAGGRSYAWTGFQQGTAYFWRINDMTASGWVTSRTGAFVPCGGPQLRGTSYACTADGKATVTFYVASPAPGTGTNWLDLSLSDNGFVPGTFIGNGPNDSSRQEITWSGILPNRPTYWRYNSSLPGGWSSTGTANFTATC